MQLHSYQVDLTSDVRSQWAAGRNVVTMVLPTGGGKTVCVSDLVITEDVPTLVVAHRDMLVSQMSLALARDGVWHDVIVAAKTRRSIAEAHMIAFGRSWLSQQAKVRVGSVDTIRRRLADLEDWFRTVRLWVVDEGHHVVLDNKWGDVIQALPAHARGLLPTATPVRMDGKGLGRHADGFADVMVQGPPLRWLIDNGFLTDYRVVCADSHIRDHLGDVAASGDWSAKKITQAARESEIVGDVVNSYLTFAAGKTGLTFATDLETAADMAARYSASGVRAEVLSGETPPDIRAAMIGRLERREIQQICAVDVISEGTDIPAIEVVTFARPTKSLGLWMQQFGRVLRRAPGKTEALAIDHVGNFLDPGLGPPDKPRQWTLDRREKRKKKDDDAIPYRVCLEPTCGFPYEAFLKACPRCGTPVPAPAARGAPAQVEGLLSYLDPAILEDLRRQTAVAEMSENEIRASYRSMGPTIADSQANNHRRRKFTLQALADVMGTWGGWQRAKGLDDEEIQRLFWMRFGTTVLHTKCMSEQDARVLHERIVRSIEAEAGAGANGVPVVAEQRRRAA